MSQRIAIDSVTDYKTREDWLAARKSGIGASESAALFDLSPYQSRLSLWLQKTGRLPDWEPSGEQAERLEWGQILEGPIADAYARRSGRKLWAFSPFCIAQHPTILCMFATPDRFIVEAPDRPGQEGELQVKNTANVWSYDGWAEGVPMHVQVQVQHELAVTGRDFATVATLANGNRLMTWDVERNEEFIEELGIACQRFWEDVLADRQPPADGHSATREAIKRLHPLDNGESIALPPEAVQIWERMQAAKQARKVAEQMIEEADAQLRILFGQNTYGLLPDGRTLSLKTIHRDGHFVAPSDYRQLRETKARAIAAHTPKGKAA